MKSITIHNKTQKSLAIWRRTGWLFECFQIEVHQSRLFSGIFVCEKPETTLLVELNGMGVCIQGNKSTSRTVAMRELIFNAFQNGLTNTLMCIGLGNSQTSYLNGRIIGTLLGERNLSIDTIADGLVVFRETDLVIEQAKVGNDVICFCINHQVCDCQQLLSVVFCIVQKKIVQVIINALERPQLCVSFQPTKPERPHAYQSKSAACLNNSYDARPRSFSVSVATVGCSMCQMKRSKSCPSKAGVSLINRAMIQSFCSAKVRHNSHTASILRRKYHFSKQDLNFYQHSKNKLL